MVTNDERPCRSWKRAEALDADVERLTNERDRAREECGHEKAMRASQREEMMGYFLDRQAARKAIVRVASVCSNTDGEWLDGDAEIPVGEVLRMLYPSGDAPATPPRMEAE